MSEQLWYYIDQAEAQQGPITIPQLQELVANGSIVPTSVVWTEALGEQWIPASNVEGLFAAEPDLKPNPHTASIPLKAPAEQAEPEAQAPVEPPAPTPIPNANAPAPMQAPAPAGLRTPDQVQDASQVHQPNLAPTTPMLSSSPTTQPVVPAVAGIPEVTPEQQAAIAAQGAYAAAPVAAAEEAAAPAKGKSPLGIILLLLGIGAAGAGGYLFSTQGQNPTTLGLLIGGGVLAILGLILTLKGKKAPAPVFTAGGLDAMATHPGTMDTSALAAAPASTLTSGVTVSATPAAAVANPLLAAGAATVKPTALAGVHGATKPNPLMKNPAAAIPANKLNTSLPAKPAEPAESTAE